MATDPTPLSAFDVETLRLLANQEYVPLTLHYVSSASKLKTLGLCGADTDPAKFVTDAGRLVLALLDERDALAARVPRWSPITEAPKDGTSVLVVVEKIVGEASLCCDGEWYWIRDDPCGKIQPTHFMPLPPAPGKEADHAAR